VSWADVSWEDAAEGDASADPSAYELNPTEVSALMADPALAPAPADLPATLDSSSG